MKHVPLRLVLKDGSASSSKWRGLQINRLDHATLCAAFNLDPARYWFDTSHAMETNPTRGQSCFVFNGPKGSRPVGRISVCDPDERFADIDPFDDSDFENMRHVVLPPRDQQNRRPVP